MKKLISISVIILGIATQVLAQELRVSSYVETTSVSPKLGVSIGRVSEFGIEYGGFYQESKILEAWLMSAEGTANLPRFYEKTFYGLFFNYPVVSSDNFDVLFNVRTGVVNKLYFVITPSFMANYKPGNRISLGAGIGIRSFRPTLQSSISINI